MACAAVRLCGERAPSGCVAGATPGFVILRGPPTCVALGERAPLTPGGPDLSGGATPGWNPKLGGSLPNAAPGRFAGSLDSSMPVCVFSSLLSPGNVRGLLPMTPGGAGMLRLRTPSVSAAAWIAAPIATTSSGIDAIERRRAEERLDALADERHARRAADEDDLVEGRRREARERERVLGDLERAIDERRDHVVEIAPRHRERVVDRRAAAAVAELLEHDRVRLGGREHHLDLFGGGLQPLEHLRVGARVVAVSLEVGLRHALGDEVVDVVAAEERVAGGREDLEDVAVEIEQRAVERAAAEVVDGDALVAGTTEAVGERGGRRLVEDAEDLETGDAAGDLRRRALELVEVRGDRDDGALDRAAERGLGDLPRALEDERADLGQRVVLAARADERALSRALP